MRKQMWMLLCVVTVSAAMLSGCCWTQRGAALGGAAGAGIGALAGGSEAGEGALIGLAAGGLAGALIGDQFEHRDWRKQLENLQKELAASKADNEALRARIKELEEKIKEQDKEIADLNAKLKELANVKPEREKIILTLLAETHYMSGKAELTDEGKKEIDRVVRIIREKYSDQEISVRGHTDTEPIKYSGWKSNWELGSARALNVLHYLMEKHGIKGEQISASTFAYYRPAADNKTAEGKRQNRRTEIVICPTQKPTVQNLVVQKPVVQTPAAQKPAAEKPVVQKPGAKKAGVKKAK